MHRLNALVRNVEHKLVYWSMSERVNTYYLLKIRELQYLIHRNLTVAEGLQSGIVWVLPLEILI